MDIALEVAIMRFDDFRNASTTFGRYATAQMDQRLSDCPSQCVYVGDVDPAHLQLCKEVMSYWSIMQDIHANPWLSALG